MHSASIPGAHLNAAVRLVTKEMALLASVSFYLFIFFFLIARDSVRIQLYLNGLFYSLKEDIPA